MKHTLFVLFLGTFCAFSGEYLANLHEIFRYPSPWGIAPGLADGSTQLERCRKTEQLLDFAGGLADEFARAAELQRSAEFLFPGKFLSEFTELYSDLNTMRKKINWQQFENWESSLKEIQNKRLHLETELNRISGGQTNMDKGSDLYCWVKYFGYVLRKKLPEYEEPTPWRAVGSGFIKLSFKSPGEKAIFRSGRVSSIYEYSDMTFRFSALTPAWIIDSGVDTLKIKILANPPQIRKISAQKFLLFLPGMSKKNNISGLVLVSQNPIRDITLQKDFLQIKLQKSGRIALVSAHPDFDAVRTADFYLRHLERIPQDIVQVQKGKEIIQYALDSRGRPAAYHPIAPQLLVSSTGKYPVQLRQKTTLSPDGFHIVLTTGKKCGISYALPDRPIRRQQGINIACRLDNSLEQYQAIRKSGADSVRIVCGYGCPWSEDGKAQKAFQHNLELAARCGLKTGIDNHHWFPENKDFGKFDSPEYQQEFIRRWLLMIQWAAPWRKNILWYDLMNEPKIYAPKEDVTEYYTLIRSAIKAIRKIDKNTPILVEVANMGNAVGAFDWEEPLDNNVIIGYHDYWPHMFTHQSVPENQKGKTNLVSYPSFCPMITWQVPSWRNDNEFFLYFDNWKCQGVSYPVLERAARTGLPVDCGEFGVVGYGSLMKESGKRWLSDAFERFRHWGFSSMIWGIHGGYTWPVPAWRQKVQEEWHKNINRR